MDRFEKVLEIEKKYRRNADRIFEKYRKEESEMRKRLSPEAFRNEFVLGRWVQIAGNFRVETDITVKKISEVFQESREELREWMVKPVEPGVLETLRCIRDFGLRLSLQELRVIELGISSSYMGKKIFESIVKDSGFNTRCINIDELLSTLDTAQSIVELRIRSYAGKGGNEGFPGRDLIEHKIINGVDMGEYSLPELAMASVEPRSNDLDYVKKLFEKAKAPISYVLSEKEAEDIAKKLDPLIDRWGDINTKGADKVREEIPDIVSRLDSMPDDYEHKEAFKKYFLLNYAGAKSQPEINSAKESESIIEESSSLEQAKEYADRRGTVNMDILNQF
ncbi:MAG: hypothetical protein HFG66_00875 [Hungatella sp.]|nr:hypothetical protein [Hungatella sp.]